jgi:hypothetical protein
LQTLGALQVNQIKRLMVFPPGGFTGHYADPIILLKNKTQQSLVVIETYSNDIFYRGDPVGVKTFVLDGINAPRVFYSPKYEDTNRKNPVYDSRATLYWEPSIKTDSSGKAKVEFFTHDRRTALEAIVNGIKVVTGNPGQGQVLINSPLKDFKSK